MSNKETVLSFFKLLAGQKVKEAFDKHIAENFKHHNQHTKAGRQALLEGMTDAHNQFPTMTIDVKNIFEDGDFVITHSLVKMSPEHNGFVCVHISRFSNGRIAEFWDLASPVNEEVVNIDGAF